MQKVIIILTLFLTACATEARAQKPQDVMLATPSMVAETPAPTVDIAAMETQLANGEATNQALAKQGLSNQATMQAQAWVIITQQSANLQATVTIGAQGIEQQRLINEQQSTGATEVYERNKQTNINLTAQANDWTATAAKPGQDATATRLAALSNNADLVVKADALFPFAMSVTISIVIVFLFRFLMTAFKYRQAPAEPEDDSPASNQFPELQPIPQTWERKNDGATLTNITPPGDHEAFTRFAHMVRSDPMRTLAKDKWEGKDSPYTRETYGSVYAWMAAHKFMNWQGDGLHLTKDGECFFDDWLLKHPTPPKDKYAKNPAPVTQTPENQTPETEGGLQKYPFATHSEKWLKKNGRKV